MDHGMIFLPDADDRTRNSSNSNPEILSMVNAKKIWQTKAREFDGRFAVLAYKAPGVAGKYIPSNDVRRRDRVFVSEDYFFDQLELLRHYPDELAAARTALLAELDFDLSQPHEVQCDPEIGFFAFQMI